MKLPLLLMRFLAGRERHSQFCFGTVHHATTIASTAIVSLLRIPQYHWTRFKHPIVLIMLTTSCWEK